MNRVSTAIAVALLTALLAGCVGGDDDSEPAPEEPTNAPDAVATEDAGSVSGQVLTSGLDEIGGATVALTQGSDIVKDTKTDARGHYTFNDVTPGEYRIQVSAACCKAAIKTINVEANEVASVPFTLDPFTAADLQEPFVKEWEWNGFISCGVATPAVRVALCSVADDPNEEFFLAFNVSKGIKTLSVGMTWEPVGGVSGGEFALAIEENVCEQLACTDAYDYDSLEGPPPLVTNIHNDDITEDAFLWDNINETAGIQFRVFAGGDLTVVYQQPFTIHVHEHYFQEAPEGYNPIPDQ